MFRTCSRVIALAVMLVGLPTAQAADTTLTLACQGTKTYASMADNAPDRETQPDPISMGIIVNLTDRTVTGLDEEPPLTIRSVNETTIAFGSFWSSTTDDVTVPFGGTIDRLTGDMAATRTITRTTSSYIRRYSLKCRQAQRMF